MKTLILNIICSCTILTAQLFINEIDYNQPSTDQSEFLEIAGLAGSYQDVTIVLINGNNNSEYNTFDLGTITLVDESQGYGFYVIGGSAIPNVDYTSGFPSSNAIQNGDPDGIELWVNGQIVDAVSYAGSMNDSEGDVMEEATPNDSDDEYFEGLEGDSIGRIGVDGSPWIVDANSPGAVNQGQTLDPDADFPPNANAGADQIVSSGDMVTLDGSGSSDPDGTIVDYLWEQTAGSSVTLSANNLAEVSFTAPQVTETTTWTFLLTVEDDGGNTSDDEVNVTVYILSQITIYDIQENFATYDGQIVNVVGVVTIGDGLLYPSKTKFYIQDESGRGIQIYNDPPLDHVYNRGDYIEVTGTVTQYADDVEITDPAITILGSDYDLPEAHTAVGDEGLTMNGTWAVAEGTLSDYWYYLSGTTEFTALTITTSLGAEIQTMFWNSAVPSAELTEYEDMVGEELSILGVITFYNGAVQLTCGYEDDIQTNVDPTLPVANAGSDQIVEPGDMVTLNGSASSDENGDIIAYEWTQISGTAIILSDEESATPTFTAPDTNGELVFRLTVWDNDFNDDDDEIIIIVSSPITIYDIQFTTDQGEYCYETPMAGETVTTSGVVTAIKPGDYPNFYLSDPTFNEWGGIYVYDLSVNPMIGDELILTATVNEYYSMTQLIDVTTFTSVTTGSSPTPVSISTGNLGIDCSFEGEAFEGMLVEVSNVTIENIDDEFGYWEVDDGSGSTIIDDYFYDGEWPTVSIGDVIGSITGVVEYSYNEFKILPRVAVDISNEDGCSADLGDLNDDGILNVLDIVILSSCILDLDCADLQYSCAADFNGDDIYNVLDIVQIVNIILGRSEIGDATSGKLIISNGALILEANGYIGGIQMTLQHEADFTIDLTKKAMVADYRTVSNETKLIIVVPESKELFTFSGDFEIIDMIVANSEGRINVDAPTEFSLSSAYPNPFNPVASMIFSLPEDDIVTVQIYNLKGQVVSTLLSGYQVADTYNLIWDASSSSSGMYFVKAESAKYIQTQKLILIK